MFIRKKMLPQRGLLAVTATIVLLFSNFHVLADSLTAGPTVSPTVGPDDWPSWGRTGEETHYSPLTGISADNVSKLKLAWHYELDPDYSPTTPIKAGDKLFVTTGHSHIRAFNAENGKLLWEYDAGTRARVQPPLAHLKLSWGNKGIAYSDGKVVLATTDGYVIALNADTGKTLWKTQDFPAGELRVMNGAPRVFGDKVVIGHGGTDMHPIRGYVSAYNLDTGKRAWRFYTVPGDPSVPAVTRAEKIMRPTWKGDWFKNNGGGGTVWNAFSYDAELGLVYIGVGNGFPYSHKLRSPGGGDNLFLASIVAVKADTGEYVWHYQVCPAEQWDCTATTDMTLATLNIDGKPRKVLMQAPKNGFLYVLDRASGELLSAEKITRVTWAEKIDLKSGRPVENPGIRYQGKPGMFELWPATVGAHSWQPQAFNPQTGLLYIPVIERGVLIGEGDAGGGEAAAGSGVSIVFDFKSPHKRGAYLKAIDPATQKEAWKIELPGGWPAGVLATGGNLVFQGRMDGSFVAYDATSGRALWQFKTPSPIVGAPISYRVNGRQYITVLTGSGGNGAGLETRSNAAYRTDYRQPRHVLTFALDGKDTLPNYEPPARSRLDIPDFQPDSARVQRGAMAYGMNMCLLCHGMDAVAGGQAPDLRYSPIITSAPAFSAIVKSGVLKSRGMPHFPDIADKDLEDLRFYLMSLSQQVDAARE